MLIVLNGNLIVLKWENICCFKHVKYTAVIRVFTRKLFLQKAPSEMFDRVWNTFPSSKQQKQLNHIKQRPTTWQL